MKLLNWKQGSGVQDPTKCLPVCSFTLFLFWSSPQVWKNLGGNTIMKQQVQICQEGFSAPFSDPPLPNFSTPWKQLCKSLLYGPLTHWVCIFIWLGMTYLQRLCFYPLLYFKACFPLSPDTSNPLWGFFFLDLKGLMVQYRTWIFGNIFQPPLTATSEKSREQLLRRANVVPEAKCPREVFVFKIKWIY